MKGPPSFEAAPFAKPHRQNTGIKANALSIFSPEVTYEETDHCGQLEDE
jgi:hypothetical protein